MTVLGYTVRSLCDNEGKLIHGQFEDTLKQKPIQLAVGELNSSQIFKNSSVQYEVQSPEYQQPVSEKVFIPNQNKQYSATDFWKEEEEDGFDIYIDSAINLPDNVSVLKVIATVVSSSGKPLLVPQTFWPKLE